jgi:hypothetical protein
MKAAIMSHVDETWTEALPLVLISKPPELLIGRSLIMID